MRLTQPFWPLNPIKKLKSLQLCKEEKAKLLTKEDHRNTQKYSSVNFISAYWGISAGNKHLFISGWKCRERGFEGSLRWGKNVLSLEIFSWIISYWILPLYKMKNSADFGGCYQASVDNTFEICVSSHIVQNRLASSRLLISSRSRAVFLMKSRGCPTNQEKNKRFPESLHTKALLTSFRNTKKKTLEKYVRLVLHSNWRTFLEQAVFSVNCLFFRVSAFRGHCIWMIYGFLEIALAQ